MGFELSTYLRLSVLLSMLYPLGCGNHPSTPSSASGIQKIRVKLLSSVDSASLSCGVPPLYQLTDQASAQELNCPRNALFNITLTPQGWRAGNAPLGGSPNATLYIQPASDGSVSVNSVAYRGKFRFVPIGGGKFDVINDLDIDAYLTAVVPREMLAGWQEEAYRAQAVVARTYALYEKQTAGLGRNFDVYADTRSQVYGGIGAESAKSRLTVADTAGIVVAFADGGGTPRIFKAYFSSCCGGVSQSAAHAFGDPYIAPLADQNLHSACRSSPRFNWGPIEVDKKTLTARFVEFGRKRNRPEQSMAPISRVEIQEVNAFGRPVRFLVTDTRGARYSLTGEEFRWAVNTNATDTSTLYSSFVKIINDSDKVRFVEGHGWGHGVGLCQWCAEKHAEDGLRHEDIILAAYPNAVLVRAY